MPRPMKTFFYLFCLCTFLWTLPCISPAQSPINNDIIEKVQTELEKQHGQSETERIRKGVSQLARNWRSGDGTEQEFADFCLRYFMSGNTLHSNFRRIVDNLTYMEGMLYKISTLFHESDYYTDTPKLEADDYLQRILPGSDHYSAKFAHYVQLNFPYYTFAEKQRHCREWNREKWAMVCLGDSYAFRHDRFSSNPFTEKANHFKRYMEHYFFSIDRITDKKGKYLYTDEIALHCHRGLRDQIKQEYTAPGGTSRQELLYAIAENATTGNIPVLFLKDTTTRWNPSAGKLYKMENGKQKEIKNYETENLHRYTGLLACMKEKMFTDQSYTPQTTTIQRTFDKSSVSLEKTETLIRNFLADPLLSEIGRIIEKRLGRKLRPYDIWYSGFQEQSAFSAGYLDSLTHSRYPDPQTFRKDLPNLLIKMGIHPQDAHFIGSHISVRPVVSGGYSSQPSLPGDTALLTTMFGKQGLDYKAFRVSMHELGHCICGVFCTNNIDYFRLAGVPCDAITEAFAELFAYKNAEALDLHPFSPEEKQHLLNLATIWYLLEMGGQTLTEIETWKWLYAHPEATAQELKEAVLHISSTIWNTYFSKIFHIRDQHILSIYNHYITGDLYLYNYFLGNVIMYQLHKTSVSSDLTEELKKACREGCTLTDLWMKKAVSAPVSTESLMQDALKAIEYFNTSSRK